MAARPAFAPRWKAACCTTAVRGADTLQEAQRLAPFEDFGKSLGEEGSLLSGGEDLGRERCFADHLGSPIRAGRGTRPAEPGQKIIVVPKALHDAVGDGSPVLSPPPLRGRVGRGVVHHPTPCHDRRMSSSHARTLRLTPTDAEIRLWSRLRRKQLDGFRFRRQQPIGPYVVDFFCPTAKLVIEVDGGQHAVRVDQDEGRSRWLGDRGFRVLRFWNNDVLANTDGVIWAIREALRT